MLSRLAELVAGSACMVCGADGSAVCEVCAARVFVARAPRCFMCNKLSAGGRTCVKCRRRSSLAGLIAPFRLDNEVRELVHRYKYERERSLARLLAAQLVSQISQSFDVLSFVPADGTRRRQRGFNQAYLLARELGKQLGQAPQATLLRVAHTPQVGARRAQRFAQVRDNFWVVGRQLEGRSVLLVDDVLTTGATLDECARVLRQHGVRTVWGAVITRR